MPISKTITFVAASEPSGDGLHTETMDYFKGKQYPWLSVVIPKLREKGYNIKVIRWDDPYIDWSREDNLVLGPVWGYTDNVDAFHAWLENLVKQGVSVKNAPAFLLWNLNKRYLKQLNEYGISTIQTEYASLESDISLEECVDILEENTQAHKFIIKGAIDAGGFHFHYLGDIYKNEKARREADSLFESVKLPCNGVIVQPFLPHIQHKGEYSFVFYEGKLSHYYLKVPKKNEKKVQAFYGGQSFHMTDETIESVLDNIKETFRPDLESAYEEVIKAKEDCLHLNEQLIEYFRSKNIPPPSSVRLDGVMINNQFYLMEVEGIEPYMEMAEAKTHDPNNHVFEHYIKSIIPTNYDCELRDTYTLFV